MTQNDVRLALAKSEAEDIANGTYLDLHKDITPSMMIAMGMEHGESQYFQIYLYNCWESADLFLENA